MVAKEPATIVMAGVIAAAAGFAPSQTSASGPAVKPATVASKAVAAPTAGAKTTKIKEDPSTHPK